MKSKLIFLHIPKSGGSTFHTVLGKRYNSYETHNVLGSRAGDSEISEFINMKQDQKSKITLLKGHMPFGLHKHLSDRFEYITFLRNPVERVISQYFYIKKNKNNPKHKEVHMGGMNIQEFVTSGIVTGMNNGHCRFLTGDIDRLKYSDTSNLLEDTLTNIEKYFLLVGITERFDESILVLSHLLGWEKLPFYIKKNVSKNRQAVRDFSQEDISKIEIFNRLDQDLHIKANKILDYQISKIDDFTLLLEEFKNKNRLLSKRWSWVPDKLHPYFV
jgi:hypothetical protein